MVIFAAVGGRMSLVGAVYGTLLVNFGKTYFSESFPELWLFLMAALFIGVVLAFPNGLAGLYEDQIKPWLARRKAARARPAPLAGDGRVPAEGAPAGRMAAGVSQPSAPRLPDAIQGQRA
jgi:urea transport system permease protein